MTEDQKRRKIAVIEAMAATARRHGKNDDLWHIEGVANRLHRLETTLGRLAVDQCNYPEYDEAKQERYEKLAEEIITKELGAVCYTQRDPRGYCIRMYLYDKYGHKWSNNWDGETASPNW